MKQRWLVLLDLLLVASMAACTPAARTAVAPTAAQQTGATSVPTTAPANPEATKVKLTFWNYWDGKNGEAIQALVDRFNKEHPAIEVENVFIGWDQLRTKLVTAAAGAELPEIAAGDMAWISQLVTADVVVDLKPSIDKDGIDLDDFYPELLKIDRYQDKVYGLPVSTNNLELFYNKDLFKAAGLDPERPPKTWDELVELAKKCNDPANGTFGMELYTQTGEGLTWQFQVYLWQAGGDFLTSDYSRAAFNTPAGKKALQFWVDLIHEYKVAPLAQWGLFEQGKAAMRMDGSWMVGILREQAPFAFGTAPMPTPADGQPATNMGGEHLVIFKTSSEKEQAAWEFVRWLTSTETQVEWDTQTGFMPVRESVTKSDEYQAWVQQTETRLAPFVESQRYAHARPRIANYAEASDVFSRELEKALQGTVSVDEALKNAEIAVNEVLSK